MSQCLQGGYFPLELPTLFLLLLCAAASPFACWCFLFFFFLFLQPSSCLVGKASSTVDSCLITICCSCACKEFNNSANVILDKSLVFSKVVMIASNLSGIVTKTFSTIRESLNSEPSNLTLLAMLKSLLEYSLMVSDYFIFYNSKSLIIFNTFMPLIRSSPSYSNLR